jgi:NAD(P)-dependent dehydrogenase (short-subunit alcohol dehydrogenase family)
MGIGFATAKLFVDEGAFVFITGRRERSFARTWTTDLKDRRIRVNALSPGYIDTAPWRSVTVAEMRANIMSSGTVPLGRFGTADEVAKAAAFLAADDSSYITGTELFVDGGVAQI